MFKKFLLFALGAAIGAGVALSSAGCDFNGLLDGVSPVSSASDTSPVNSDG